MTVGRNALTYSEGEVNVIKWQINRPSDQRFQLRIHYNTIMWRDFSGLSHPAITACMPATNYYCWFLKLHCAFVHADGEWSMAVRLTSSTLPSTNAYWYIFDELNLLGTLPIITRKSYYVFYELSFHKKRLI